MSQIMGIEIVKKLKAIMDNPKKKTDLSIAKFILENIGDINSLTTLSISKKCFTSPAGVIRFCQRLGLSGLNELKFELKHLSSQNKHLKEYQFIVANNLINEEKKFLTDYLAIKNKSAEVIHENFLKKDTKIVIDKLVEAPVVYIFCFNLAHNFSCNFAHRLRWTNKKVVHENDINAINSYVSIINEQDVVIVISLGGNSEYIDKILSWINKKCFIFAILGNKSKFIKKVDDYFIIESDEKEMWDVFSIRGQTLVQLLDYIYAIFIKRYI